MATGFRGSIVGVAFAFLAMGTIAAPAYAQQVAPIRSPGPAIMVEARAAFEALDETIRREIQSALIWTGDYAGAIDGAFGPRTFEAILAHQRRERLPQTGILLRAEIDELLAIAEAEREAVGFAFVDDPLTDVRIGIPLGLMERRPDPSHGGARWQTPDERVTLDTRIFAPGEAELAALFERLTGPGSGRQVTYRLLRDDFLVVAGETTGGKFYIRYDLGGAGIRGFSIGYDKALARPFDWLTLAIAGSFTAFPADSAPLAPIASAPEAPLGTGLLVALNTILTSASLDSCRSLRAAGRPVTARERIGEALLLTADIDREPASVPSGSASNGNTRVVVLAAAGTEDAERLTATPGEVRGDTLSAPLQTGATGAPVFDRNGRIIGIVYDFQSDAAATAGIVPPNDHALIRIARLVDVLASGDRRGSEDMTAGAIATDFGAAVISVFCEN